jgi:hypothetical protein
MYKSGEIENISSIPTGGTLRDDVDAITTQKSLYDKNYIVNHDGVKYIMVTTNHKLFGSELRANDEHKCQWCRESFGHQPIGIPIKIIHTSDNVEMHVDGCFCRTSCAYAFLKTMRRYTNEHERNLRYLHSRIHEANVPLIEAKPFDLHENCGGPLSNSQFHHRLPISSVPSSFIFYITKAQYPFY